MVVQRFITVLLMVALVDSVGAEDAKEVDVMENFLRSLRIFRVIKVCTCSGPIWCLVVMEQD